jgi:hypothetical protein
LLSGYKSLTVGLYICKHDAINVFVVMFTVNAFFRKFCSSKESVRYSCYSERIRSSAMLPNLLKHWLDKKIVFNIFKPSTCKTTKRHVPIYDFSAASSILSCNEMSLDEWEDIDSKTCPIFPYIIICDCFLSFYLFTYFCFVFSWLFLKMYQIPISICKKMSCIVYRNECSITL